MITDQEKLDRLRGFAESHKSGYGILSELAQEFLDLTPCYVPDDSSRCAVCGWPLQESADEGCIRGNCSMRPRPGKLYNIVRAETEAAGEGRNDG